MYTDALNLFSDAQAMTDTAVSTNVIDLGVDRNVGQGEPLAAVIQVDIAALVDDTDETYEIQILTDADDTPSDAIASRSFTNALATAQLTAGARFVIPLPHDNERYVRLNYVLAGTTAGWTVTAFLVPMSMIPAEEKYADGFTIS